MKPEIGCTFGKNCSNFLLFLKKKSQKCIKLDTKKGFEKLNLSFPKCFHAKLAITNNLSIWRMIPNLEFNKEKTKNSLIPYFLFSETNFKTKGYVTNRLKWWKVRRSFSLASVMTSASCRPTEPGSSAWCQCWRQNAVQNWHRSLRTISEGQVQCVLIVSQVLLILIDPDLGDLPVVLNPNPAGLGRSCYEYNCAINFVVR